MLLLVSCCYAQTATQQKALNNFADFANQSADEVAAVVMSVIQYYPSINQKKSFSVRSYVCPIQPEEYYLKTAIAESRSLPAPLSTGLLKKLNDLEAAAQVVDDKCKALDTYHKLEDYKKDNFARAVDIIEGIQAAVRDYRISQNALVAEMDVVMSKLNPAATQTAYGKADAILKKQIARERDYLDTWTFNLSEDTPTGWPVDKLTQSIAETSDALSMMKKQQLSLKYPASSMWSGFQESLSSVLEAKRNALDGYNNEAKKADRHANDAYLGLINYFNGTLVSDQIAFIQYASNDGYRGVKAVKYFPLFENRLQAVVQSISVKPFSDYPRTAFKAPAQKNALSKQAYSALVNYVDFINETWRQTGKLSLALINLSGDAKDYDKVDSYGRHRTMNFDYKDFTLPLAQYQKTITESNVLPAMFSKPLNQQAEVLLNILKELDAISATLEAEVSSKQYEADRAARIYVMLQRTDVLLRTWDERKEMLYQDVREVFDAFPPVNASSSWFVSGTALQHLTDLDHDALFKARDYYRSGRKESPPAISTEAIDEALRDVISKEYQNMKGIEKYGRSNGLCPYTPYEDLPETSKKLSEKLNPLSTKQGTGYQHPYYEVLYQYNDVVRYYNQFCELSKEDFLLPTVYQPQIFELNNPQQKAVSEVVSGKGAPGADVGAVHSAPTGSVAQAGTATSVGAASTTHSSSVNELPTTQTPVAVKAQEQTAQNKLQRDTIYIERRDTVYLTSAGEELRSMEGYAVNHMVLLLDVSGSMNAPEKLPILKTSVLGLITMMRPEDKVSIIAFSDKPRALLTSASFKDEARIQAAIKALKSSGKTDGNSAVKLAYKIADENYIRGGNNRIILATDGEFVMNETTRELIKQFSSQDIFLSIFNFGKGAGASKALEQVAAMGKGNYQRISKENVDLQLILEAKAKRAH